MLWPLEPARPVHTDHPVAIVGVTLIDVAGGASVPGRTVVVERGRITAVGPAGGVALPRGAARVDGRGLFLMPALWDMHTHVFAVSPLLDMPLYVAYGVTNVRDMLGCPRPGDPFIACPADKRRWSREAEQGLRVGPRIRSSASFMANGPTTRERVAGVPPFFGTATPEEARAFVRHQAATGAQEIKVYDLLPREAYFALAAEARRHGLPVVGHRPRGVSLAEAAAAGQKSVEHARDFLHESFPGSDSLRAAAGTGRWREDRARMVAEHDPRRAAELFRVLAARGTWYVPTHLTRRVDAYADDASVREDTVLRYLHPLMKWQWMEDVNATLARDSSPAGRRAYRDFYHKGLELTGAAHRAGVGVLAGTDYLVAGVDLHRELGELVKAGLSPAEALRAATVSPARYYGLERDYGGIVPGKVADLVLLEGNPLHDIRNTQRIRAVVFNGNLYDREALGALRALVRRRARSWTVGCKILWRFIRQPASY